MIVLLDQHFMTLGLQPMLTRRPLLVLTLQTMLILVNLLRLTQPL